MSRVFIPTRGPDDWKALLADPEKQWARGYSARTLAGCWESCDGFPPEIAQVLRQHPALARAEPLLIFPEWKVPLPGGARSSQNDVWVLARSGDQLLSMAVEGKVDEPFGVTLGEWKSNASRGREERLSYLLEVLGLDSSIPDGIRYQLLHRTASAIIEAGRFNADHALMIVHSFSPEHHWFEDFAFFVSLFGKQTDINTLVTLEAGNSLPLHLAWVSGNRQFLHF